MLGIPMNVEMLAKVAGVKTADLSQVDDPRGRVDFLASQVIAHVVGQLGNLPEVQATYNAARPLIDGLLVQHLGKVRVSVPKEAVELVRQMNGDKAA